MSKEQITKKKKVSLIPSLNAKPIIKAITMGKRVKIELI